jgi:hypothetical protein
MCFRSCLYIMIVMKMITEIPCTLAFSSFFNIAVGSVRIIMLIAQYGLCSSNIVTWEIIS